MYFRSRSIRSANLTSIFPLSLASVFLHVEPSSNAALAAATALSTSALSPSWTSMIFSPVDGLIVGNVFPLTELTHSLLMNNCVYLISGFLVGAGGAGGCAMVTVLLGCKTLKAATSSYELNGEFVI